ncbi:MAG: PaaI family thioesterase [Nitrososphaerales archaeon]
MTPESLQDRYAPHGVCFGCGPANENGLRIRSIVEGDRVVARWTPRPYHHAFGQFLSGGIISTILDCHSNWTGAYSLMVEARGEAPPPTVTASISVEFLKPTPIAQLLLEARPKEVAGRKVVVESTLSAEGTVTAALRGTFIAVGPDHPAAKRWLGDGDLAPGGT